MRTRRTRRLGPIGSIFFGAVFLAIGLFVGFTFGKPVLDKAKASEQWPSVQGVVTHSEVTSHTSDGKRMYSADVLYSYEVGGKSYEGSTIRFGGNNSSSSSSDAHETVAKYPVQREVPVYYNATAAYECVLEPGAFLSSYMVFGIGMLFAVVGGLIGLGGIWGVLRRLLALGARAIRS